jgi:FkbM family methyltransferase
MFYSELIKTLLSNAKNDFSDDENYDVFRFGKLERHSPTIRGAVRKRIEKTFNKNGFYVINRENLVPQNLDILDGYFEGLSYLYDWLSDGLSKDLLLQLIAYKILGRRRVKLPLSTPSYWEGISKMDSLANHNDFIDVKFMNLRLSMIDLNKVGIPLKFYFSPSGAYIDFGVKQYEFSNGATTIKAQKGDYVIDAGGCWGDTALYFANEVGDAGKVFTYEFIPSNLAILKKNLSLNPAIKERIVLIEKPVWENSESTMFYIDQGPGSRVFMKNENTFDGQVKSLSIDQLVKDQGIQRIDFIKMDIEGAEPHALKGALETIKKFKPKLAIAIYHGMDDFVNIPRFINELDLNYKLHLAHCSIHEEETILFAEIAAP